MNPDAVLAALNRHTDAWRAGLDADHAKREAMADIARELAPHRRRFTRQARAIIRTLDGATRWTLTDTRIDLSMPYYSKADKPLAPQVNISIRARIRDNLAHTTTDLDIGGQWPDAPAVIATLRRHVSALLSPARLAPADTKKEPAP
jgi:hypothetical protein